MKRMVGGRALALLAFAAALCRVEAQNPPLTIANDSFPDGLVGVDYLQNLRYSGGCASDLTPKPQFTVQSGALPPGLAISVPSNAGSILAGKPTAAGAFPFTLKVADSCGASATKAFSIKIAAAGTLPRSAVLGHLAAGGGWDTTLTLINSSAAAVTVRINFLAEDGSALSVPLNVTQQNVSQPAAGSTLDMVLAANATAVIAIASQSPSTAVGWADVLSSAPLSGFAMFRQTARAGQVSEGSAPLQAQFPAAMMLPYDNAGGAVMGIAIVNLSPAAAALTATIWDDNGNRMGTQVIPLAGSGHASFALPDQLPLTVGRRGILQLQSPASEGIAALGLRFSPSSSFTSIPAILGQ